MTTSVTVYYAPDPINSTQLIPGSNTPAAGAQLFCYAAGSSAKQNMYTSNLGNATWTNPLVLDSGGNIPGGGEIWIPAGLPAKFILAPSNDSDPPLSPYWTKDNLSGVNDAGSILTEWIPSGLVPTFVNASTFILNGDQTSTFTLHRRIRTLNTAGTFYGIVSSSIFGTSTTIGIVSDSTGLDSGLSSVSYGLLSEFNTSIPGIGKTNTVIGFNAFSSNASGINNTVFGAGALSANTVGQNNTAIGINALKSTVGTPGGNNNTAVGLSALSSNILGDNNTAVGFGALSTSNFDENTAVGVNALANASSASRRNTAVGAYASQAGGSFLQVVAVGYNALNVNTASNNTALGAIALQLNTSGTANTAVGAGSLQTNTVGNNNTAVGLNAAATCSTATDVTAIGTNALLNALGTGNTALGSGAGTNVSTGTNLTIIGSGAQPSGANISNEITLGDANITAFRIPGAGLAVTTNILCFVTATTAVGASTATLTNSPHNGNPTIWPRIAINGSTFCFPCFLTN